MSRGPLVSRVADLGRKLSVSAACRPRVLTVPSDNRPVEESPEQVLARLARYRDSLKGAPPYPVAVWDAGDRVRAAPRVEPARPSARAWRYSPELGMTLSSVRTTLVGHLLAVFGCAFAVLAFEHATLRVAEGVVVVAAAVGLIALARRVPLAVWWTLGVVIGGALGRWS
jgi:hypothetical protein